MFRSRTTLLLITHLSVGVVFAAVAALFWKGWPSRDRPSDSGRDYVGDYFRADIESVDHLLAELDLRQQKIESRIRSVYSEEEYEPRRRFLAALLLAKWDPSMAGEIAAAYATSSPISFRLLVDRFGANRSAVGGQLSQSVLDPDASDIERLSSACFLSHLDRDRLTDDAIAKTFQSLRKVALHNLSLLVIRLEPIKHQLRVRFQECMVDESVSSPRRFAIAHLYCELFPHNYEDFVEMALETIPGVSEVFAERLSAAKTDDLHGIVQSLHGELRHATNGKWASEGVSEFWETVSPESKQWIVDSDGMLNSGFAFVSHAKLNEFESRVQQLRSSGYRPFRARPFGRGAATGVAAIWKRDSANWRLVSNAHPENWRTWIGSMYKNGYVPVDAAAYWSESNETRYILVFEQTRARSVMDATLGIEASQHQANFDKLRSQRFLPSTIQVTRSNSSQRIISQTWSRPFFDVKTWEQRSSLNAAQLLQRKKIRQIVDVSIYPIDDNTRFAVIAREPSGYSQYETEIVIAASPLEHLDKCRPIAGRGFRPVAIDAFVREGSGPQLVSIWQRPFPDLEQINRAVKRKAKAAELLFLLGETMENDEKTE